MTYHVALIKGTGRTAYWGNGHKADTVIVQARRNIDYLDCEIWQYMGERETTKVALRARIMGDKARFLSDLNRRHGTHFTRVVFD